MIKVGDTLPAVTLMEYVEVEGNGCSLGPNPVDTVQASAGKTIALFAVPGAFTPTCSAKHVPGYVEKFADLKAAGVDEIWCVSVNDAFVMGAWARDQKTDGKVRMQALCAPRRPHSRRLCPSHRPDARPERQGLGPAQQPLLHAGERRQGRQPEY